MPYRNVLTIHLKNVMIIGSLFQKVQNGIKRRLKDSQNSYFNEIENSMVSLTKPIFCVCVFQTMCRLWNRTLLRSIGKDSAKWSPTVSTSTISTFLWYWFFSQNAVSIFSSFYWSFKICYHLKLLRTCI